MKVKAIAPTRVDLSGGTLDLFPLYVFEGGGLTINAAIDLYSEVEIEPRDDRAFLIESSDLGVSLRAENLEEDDWSQNGGPHPLDLVFRVLQYYRPSSGLNIRTHSHVPPGSGLGGSSSLLISLSTALVQLENRPLAKQDIIDVGANIEARSLQIPTGKQDYYPPAFGGFSALWFRLDGIDREELNFSPRFRQLIQDQVLLGYTGASRFSGTNNWNMMKRYIDRRDSTVQKMRQIKQTAERMYRALGREDLEGFAECLAEEWRNRQSLAEGVSTDQIERIFRAAQEAGALASKICGAGGGGCFISVVREGRQSEVRRAVQDAGGEILDYKFVDTGVRLVE